MNPVNAGAGPASAAFVSRSGTFLGWLGAGMTEEQILDEHPDLEKEDFAAVYPFAAETGRKANPG